ncbi:hypothetical protein CH341_30085 [Rhodoplanes roseus]|uniref:Anti-sigma factor NepR domain-containing protein n=1 Tax=Rhodoplanes roseus TaxID=29409 RepID=A0A327KDJ6_9BRAD|nr:hypothetical protein CH341_30085 [Rhodoplanes roseus]
MQVRSTTGRPDPALNREIQTKIGQQLRAIYDDVVDQGVPDRFAELLRNLDAPSVRAKAADKDSGE